MLSNHESFGLVFLEAWCSGLPVIGSDAGAISSVIKDQADGLLVPYGNSNAVATAILRLWREPALRAQMSATGQAKIKAQYTWDIVVQQFREVYCEAIAHPHTVRR